MLSDLKILVERWYYREDELMITLLLCLLYSNLPCRGTEETEQSDYEAEAQRSIDLIGIAEYKGGVIMNVVVDGSTSYDALRLSCLFVHPWMEFGDQSGHFEY